MSKLGRNDPCPCGSGKKYKKCCANSKKSTSVLSKIAEKPTLNPSLIAKQWMQAQQAESQKTKGLKLVLDRYLVRDSKAIESLKKLGKKQDQSVLFYRGKAWIGEADLSIEGEVVVTTADLQAADEIKKKLTSIPNVQYESRTEDVFETLDQDDKERVSAGMLEFKVAFFQSWLDEPNERLKGHTPRQAARHPELKKPLTDLIKELEKREQKLPRKERYRFTGVKRELNL